jgi:hypothetical protein
LPFWTVGILTASGTDSIAAHATSAIRIDAAFETDIVDAEQSGRTIAVRSAPFGTDAGVAILTGGAILRRAAASASAFAANAFGAVAILAALRAGSVAANALGAVAIHAAFGTRAIAADALGALAVLATFSASARATHAVRAITVLAAFGAGSIAAGPAVTVAIITAAGTCAIATDPVVAIVIRAAFGAGSVVADAIGTVGIRTAFDAGSGNAMRAIRTVVFYATFSANVSATTSVPAVAVRFAPLSTSAAGAIRTLGAIVVVTAFGAGTIAAHAVRAIRIGPALDAAPVDAMQSFCAVAVRPAPVGAGASVAVLTGWAVLRGAAAGTSAVAADTLSAVAILATFGARAVATDALEAVTVLAAFDASANAATPPT